MSNKDTAPELKVSENVAALAKKIQKELKIGEGGVVVLDKSFYENTLPEGLSLSDVKRVQEHNADVISATGLALGLESIPYFKKNGSAEMTTVDFKIGSDEVGLQFARRKSYPAIGNRPAVENYGVLSAKYTAAGAVSTRGTFKKIKSHLAEKAAGSLAD